MIQGKPSLTFPGSVFVSLLWVNSCHLSMLFCLDQVFIYLSPSLACILFMFAFLASHSTSLFNKHPLREHWMMNPGWPMKVESTSAGPRNWRWQWEGQVWDPDSCILFGFFGWSQLFYTSFWSTSPTSLELQIDVGLPCFYKAVGDLRAPPSSFQQPTSEHKASLSTGSALENLC